jgi:regulatory protein YycH of two-component signal transduction system YycFG
LVLNLYPNPASTTINLDLSINIPGETNLQIFDKVGKMVFNHSYPLQNGFNRIIIDVKDYSKGKYNIQLRAPEGSESIEFVKY